MRTTLWMWTIYDHPRDFPHHFVVRAWAVDGQGPRPSPECSLHDTLAEARAAIPAWMVRLPRDPNDDPNIMETYI